MPMVSHLTTMALPSRIVVFDLDQTLIANAGMTDAWEAICRRRGADLTHALETWHGSAGRPLTEQVEVAFRLEGADALVDEIVDEFWSAFDHSSPIPVAGAEETLTALTSAGVPLYLSTASAPAPVQRWLRLLGWESYFRLVLATDRSLAKGPAHYSLIIADSGLDAAEFGRRAVAVGDGTYDMALARQQGVRLRVGYAPSSSRRPQARERLIEAGANLLIDDLLQVATIISHPDPESTGLWSPKRLLNSRDS